MTSSLFKLMLVAAVVLGASASRSAAQTSQSRGYYGEVLPFHLQRNEPAAAVLASPSDAGDAGDAGADTPGFLENWPHPADEPASLFRQAAVPMPYACAPIGQRYFENDPLVQPPSWPQPGFVGDVEVQAVGAHIFQSLSNGVAVGPSAPGSLRIPITPLDWTASPRFEVGYRLPEGFGAFMLTYQYIGATGSGSTLNGPNGYAGMSGRLNLNMSDFDYVSREFTPWEHWGMQWRFGFRQVYLFYDTQLTNSLAAATAGNGVLTQSGTDGYRGWGGHIGVQLDRDLNQQLPGLSFVAKLDFADTAGFVQQSVNQTTAAGAYYYGNVQQGQAVPSLSGEFGLSYRPPGNRSEFYVGAYYQYWWNVGTMPNFALNVSGAPTSGGEMSLTGITFRYTYNY